MIRTFALGQRCITGLPLIGFISYRWFHTGKMAVSGRGALVILEGCDRTGKSTQCKLLVDSLNAAGKPATLMRFPDRTTPIGSIINNYLACGSDLDDHAIHLLFSANRWEAVEKIKKTLVSGTTVIVDRYAFSGVAFSAAKEGLTLEWCKQSDVGLPRPDKVLFLDLTIEAAQKRGQFGEERYETSEFQKKVYDNYHMLKDETWQVFDADKTIEDLKKELVTEVTKVINSVDGMELRELWK